MDRTPLTRRALLRAAGVTAAAGLAGCPAGSETPGRTGQPTGADPTDAGSTDAGTATDEVTMTGTPTATDGPPAAIAEWIADAAVPLGTTDPTASLAPMAPLASAFEDARIVGLGEATHGTRELFLVKHRLIRFLVAELDYRVVAWEANFSTCRAIDEYVRGGTGDAATALAGVDDWMWRTESVLALVEWLRSFNEGRDPDDRVAFHGVDVKYATDASERLLAYLDEVDATVRDEVAADLETLADQGLREDGETPVDERLSAAESVVATLDAAFEDNRAAWVAASSAADYRLARRNLWTLDRSRAYNAAEDRAASSEIRDRAMADGVAWALDHEDADGLALWAHNTHVGTSADLFVVDPMGLRLRETFGDAYYALATDVGHGRVRALSLTEGELAEFTIDEPPADSFTGVLSAAEGVPYALDFASVANPDLSTWLSQRHALRDVGTVFGDDWTRGDYSQYVDPTAAFDGLAFVRESTPTRPIAGPPTPAATETASPGTTE